jgi:hypothetical protein
MSHSPHRIFLGLCFVALLALTACDQAGGKQLHDPKEQPMAQSRACREPNPMRPLPGMAEQAACCRGTAVHRASWLAATTSQWYPQGNATG